MDALEPFLKYCWVFPSSVMQTILSWQGAIVGKKRKKIWLEHLFAYFGLYGEKEIRWCLRVVFESGVTFAQRTKATFLSNGLGQT